MSLLQDQSAEYFVAFLAGIKSVLPMEEVLNLKQQDFYFDDGEVKLFNKITNEDGRTTMVYWGAMLDELNMYREWLEAHDLFDACKATANMFPELEASRNQPLSFKKFDEIVAKTGDQIGTPFCADCAQRIGAYELYQQTNQSVEALMTVLDLPCEENALDFIGEEVTLL
ncbi:hypothetical protein PS425_08225 [Limosilactobacillus fermentum]|uniref:hypothetical protein n=1 Tax=Limosilactobacillus fermentum TaxID=1613 RepID=UPI002F26B8DB